MCILAFVWRLQFFVLTNALGPWRLWDLRPLLIFIIAVLFIMLNREEGWAGDSQCTPQIAPQICPTQRPAKHPTKRSTKREKKGFLSRSVLWNILWNVLWDVLWNVLWDVLWTSFHGSILGISPFRICMASVSKGPQRIQPINAWGVSISRKVIKL